MFLDLQRQPAYSSFNATTTIPTEEQNQNQNQTEVLCNELAILNSLHQDTETLPSTAAGQSLSEQECGFKPNIATSQEGNQASDGADDDYRNSRGKSEVGERQ
jgi:hypothetical protein